MFRKVVVGVSGGVDSSVSAHLLKQKGFNVQAVFMNNWDAKDETGQCSSDEDWHDAQLVCDKLKIPIVKVDFVRQYWNDVFMNFLRDFENGETPNPDINCNKHVKFDAFYSYAREHLMCDAIATGHYARSSFGSFLEYFQPNENVKLLRSNEIIKDQTFFLSQVPQESLRRTMFPVGDMLKENVKRLAGEIGLTEIARKKESMGICFIGKRNFNEFISEYIAPLPGTFVDIETGKVVGKHDGIHYLTLGQRTRLVGMKQKTYVLRKMSDKRTILVASGHDNCLFYSDLMTTTKPHWIDKSPFEHSAVVELKFCFQHVDPLENCRVVKLNDGLVIQLERPLRSVTPGQYAVLYRDNECLGSAKIITTFPLLNQFSHCKQTNVMFS